MTAAGFEIIFKCRGFLSGFKSKIHFHFPLCEFRSMRDITFAMLNQA